ncbi:hypothetical protein [Owenweeksia hongkongensis]|uniref:hypothetical protein n=1 Tax=Owenweeksia hongkongensis TaxID=253245 RepID=UPI003A8FBEC9
MKKLFTLALVAVGLSLSAQKKKDDIVYYDDANVKHSKFGIALITNPNFSDRRLINNETPEDGDFLLTNNRAIGSFQLNYGIDIIYSLGSALDISVGFGHGGISYKVEDVLVNDYESQPGDTTTFVANFTNSARWYTIPFKFNFNTSINDIWDLEVVPAVQLNLPYEYTSEVKPVNTMIQEYTYDGTDDLNSPTFTVGLSLGGTYKFADNWGLIVRGNVSYMLNALIEQPNYPRETTLSFGIDLGLKYSF